MGGLLPIVSALWPIILLAMDLQEFQRQLRTFSKQRDWEKYHSPKNLVMALSVEVAELVEPFMWLTEEQSQDLALSGVSVQDIEDEVADVMLYLLQFADKLDIDIESCVMRKLQRNAMRFPVTMGE